MSAYSPEMNELILSFVRAMLGEIPCSLRRISTKLEDKLISVQFIFDGPIIDDDRDSASDIALYVIADFATPFKIHEEYIRLDAPQRLPDPEEGWRLVFQRKEPGN